MADEFERNLKTQTRSAVHQEDSVDRRTLLAADRTVFAAERTYAAWVRTGLAALASGVGARAALSPFISARLVLVAATVLIVFSAFCFLAAVWRKFDIGAPPPHPDVKRLPRIALVSINAFLLLVSFCALIGIFTARLPNS